MSVLYTELWLFEKAKKKLYFWSHTCITENAEHRKFDVQNIENIRPNDSMFCTSKFENLHLSLKVHNVEFDIIVPM